jgi:hypothetical protein
MALEEGKKSITHVSVSVQELDGICLHVFVVRSLVQYPQTLSFCPGRIFPSYVSFTFILML